MKKKVLLIGGNYFPEPTGIGKYNGEMMKWLARQGNNCTVVTTYPYYPHWKIQSPYEKKSLWFSTEQMSVSDTQSINIIRCPHYVPKNPNGLTRLISEFSFFIAAYIVVLFLIFKKKFDFIITVAPPFEIGLLGLFYKLFRGGKVLYHIQDLQVDAARDLQMIKSKFIINIFLKLECFIIKNADIVSTISLGMIDKVKEKCTKEVVLFPNWVDIDSFYPVENKAELKRSYGFSPTDTVILYAGGIGQKQGLEAILDAAKSLEDVEGFKFAICGSGPYKERLVHLKNEMNLKNVFFLPLQPSSEFNAFLNMADLHLVLQRAGAADLVLPSKLTTILSVGGVAIVTANEGTSLYDIMNSTNMGVLIEPENQETLVSAITNVKDFEFKEMALNARLYAETHLSSDKILTNYFSKAFSYNIEKKVFSYKAEMPNGVESVS